MSSLVQPCTVCMPGCVRNPDTVTGVPFTNYLDWSTYHYQLDRWLEHFPLSQFKFVSFTELQKPDDIDAQLADVHEFIGLPQHSYKNENGDVRVSNVNDEGAYLRVHD